MKKLELNEMASTFFGGSQLNKNLSTLCGIGITLSVFGGLLGAALFGPATIGVCMGAHFTD